MKALARWKPQSIPQVAVSEDARGYVLKADLPEVKQEDVKITLEDGTLIDNPDVPFQLLAVIPPAKSPGRGTPAQVGAWHHGGINE